MWLQVKNQPEKKILLAKYYPSTGWYVFHIQEKLDEWFENNFNEPSQFGRTDLELVFQETNNKRSDAGKVLDALYDAFDEKEDLKVRRYRMNKREEIANQLNQYAKEINEAIRSEPDEITGQRSFNPIISEFMIDRNQFTILTAFFNTTCSLAVDMHEPLSKKLVAERMLGACYNLLDLSEQHVEKLEEYLAQGEKK